MEFIFPIKGPYTIGLRHGQPYPDWFQKLYHLTNHRGVDIIAAKGTTVFAPASGHVTYPVWHPQGGKIIKLGHEDGVMSWMAHFENRYVKNDSYIEKGQPIGEVGSSGVSSGPHLHWHCYDSHGVVIDPLQFIKINQELMTLINNHVKVTSKFFNDLIAGNVALGQVKGGKPYIIRNSHKKYYNSMTELLSSEAALYVTQADADKIPNQG